MSNINHPTHYNKGKIEVIEFIEDQGMSYHRGNAIKYIARAGQKDPAREIEDLEKAAWYLKREIELTKARIENRSPRRPNDMNPRSTSVTDASTSAPTEAPQDSAKPANACLYSDCNNDRLEVGCLCDAHASNYCHESDCLKSRRGFSAYCEEHRK